MGIRGGGRKKVVWGGVVWRADRDGELARRRAEDKDVDLRCIRCPFSTLPNEDPKGNPHPRAGHAMWIVRR